MGSLPVFTNPFFFVSLIAGEFSNMVTPFSLSVSPSSLSFLRTLFLCFSDFFYTDFRSSFQRLST